MSGWKGAESEFCTDALPHISVESRKPVNRGTEAKAICDGQSNIMLKFEILEGKTVMQRKRYCQQYGATTATVLRLAEHYNGSGRIIIGDSWFSSMKTLCALKERGLFFIGIIKTAHRLYPIAYFRQWHKAGWTREFRRPIGSWIVLQARFQPDGVTLYPYPITALCWHDIKPKMLVSNVGTTIRHPADYERPRTRRVVVNGIPTTERYSKKVQRPRLIEMFYRHFGAIDRHDAHRQGQLNLEDAWLTKTWWHRLFATIVGIIFTDSFFAYRWHENLRHNASPLSYIAFLDALAMSLIFNEWVIDRAARNVRMRPDEPEHGTPAHTLAFLRDLRYYRHLKSDQFKERRARLRCRICHEQTSYYCVTCSKNRNDEMSTRGIYPCCGQTKDCFMQHIIAAQDPGDSSDSEASLQVAHI